MIQDPKATLRTIIDPILARPGAGTIELLNGFLSYHANAEDMPRIIGKQGINITALKRIMQRPGLRLTIVEPGYQVPLRPPARFTESWNPDRVKAVIVAALSWHHRNPGVTFYKEGAHWKVVLMDTGMPRDLRGAIVQWASAVAMGTGGKLLFEESEQARHDIARTPL